MQGEHTKRAGELVTPQSRLIERISRNFVQTGVGPRDRSGRVSFGQYDRPMRVWIDLTNTAHVLVLRPLVERLEGAGHEVELTARPLSHTLELLDDWGHRLHGPRPPRRRRPRWQGARRRLARPAAAPLRARPAASTARSPTARPTSRRSRAPSAYRTRRCSTTSGRRSSTPPTAGSRTACSSRTRSRRAARPLRRAAAQARAVPGTEGGVLPLGFRAGRSVCSTSSASTATRPLAVVRTAPSYALYLGGSENSLLRGVLERLAAGRRADRRARWTDEQRRAVRRARAWARSSPARRRRPQPRRVRRPRSSPPAGR